MDKFINLRLLSHPINWLTIILMLVIAGIGGHLLLSLVGVEPSTGDTPSTPYSPAPKTS